MISKNKKQLIKSLAIRKFREKHGLFVAEGPKLVEDLLPSFEVEQIFATKEWLISTKYKNSEVIECTDEDISSCSLLPSSRNVIALFKLKRNEITIEAIDNNLSLALDNIQDPGNLGTIIRVADWFGISQIICSKDSVDVYNPKVIQSTMGSLARVNVAYCNLAEVLNQVSVPIYGTYLNGTNIYKTSLQQKGIIVMGNEGKGISDEITKFVSNRLFIPPYPANSQTAESLNVAMATGIICSEFRRG